MKKVLLTLFVSLFICSCSSSIYYFSRETDCPQCVVDSLLGPNTSNYLEWTNFQTIGLYQEDSTLISTYVNVLSKKQSVTVVEYEVSKKSTVSEKRRK